MGMFMSGQAMGLLPSIGKEVKIHTYLNVKEDAMQLYGFLTKDDLEVFKLLIGVNGIGPKGGLGVLSALSPDELRICGNVKRCQGNLPGARHREEDGRKIDIGTQRQAAPGGCIGASGFRK